MEHTRQQVLAGEPMVIGYGEHDPGVITLGRHASESQVIDRSELQYRNIEIIRVNRGGGATYHGPGQLVIYPVVSLSTLEISIGAFTNILEESMIHALFAYGIAAQRNSLGPGVYIGDAKIGSVGIHIQHGVTTHGLCMNIQNDLSIYNLIMPCGVVDGIATSMTEILSPSPLSSFPPRNDGECKDDDIVMTIGSLIVSKITELLCQQQHHADFLPMA